PRQVRAAIDLVDREAFNIVTASGKEPHDTRQDPRFIGDQDGKAMAGGGLDRLRNVKNAHNDHYRRPKTALASQKPKKDSEDKTVSSMRIFRLNSRRIP